MERQRDHQGLGYDQVDGLRVRKQLVEEGLDAVLSRESRERPPVARIFDGEKEAKLIALACSQPPEGFVRWSLRLLWEGRRTQYRRPRQRQHDWACAKKNIVQPHRKKCWVIPPEAKRLRSGDGGCAGCLHAAA